MDDKEYKILSERIDKLEMRIDKQDCKIEKMDDEIGDMKVVNMEIKTKLTNLELSTEQLKSSNEQIKNMVNETSKDNQKLTMELINVIKENQTSDNKRKLTVTEKTLAIIATAIGGLMAYLGLK